MAIRLARLWIGVPALLLGAVAVTPLPDPATAAEISPAAGDGGTNARGAFSTSIPIEVPEFRDLEPDLSLSYDSGTVNGFTGIGWTLSGQSFVERAAPGRGVPRYDANDMFLLDGQELVGCTSLGGTHCTRQQGFQRIRRDTTGDRWEVWDTDGTKSTYAPVYTTARGAFRWGLVEERDTHGNVVTYGYWRQAPENTYLDTISYNGTVIKLWRESRPDPVSFTNGEAVAYTRMRLKTVEVSTGGSRVRAYQLGYAQAPGTGRSRLSSVREYGRDAVLDSTGAVTGGTAMPAVSLSYQDGTARLNSASFNGSVGGWDPVAIRDMFGDIDGDGRTDLVRVYKNGTSAYAQVNRSDGTGYPSVAWNSSIGTWNSDIKDFLADVTGDGRADLVRIWPNSSAGGAFAQVNPSNGAGFPTQSFNASVGGWNPCCIKELFADVNADSKADLVRIWKDGTAARAQVSLSDGKGYPVVATNNPIGGWNDSTLDYLADVSGDSKADLVRIWDNGSAFAQVNPSNGTGFPTQTFNGTVGGWNPGHVYNHLADLNGDGKSDLVRIWDNGGAYAQVSLSTGLGYPAPSWNGGVGGWNPSVISDQFADVNGDGRADLVRVYKQDTSRNVEIRPYDGTGFQAASFNQSIGGWGDTTWRSYLVDVGGDAKADVVTIWDAPGTGANAQVNHAAGVMPDLLTSVNNGIGGRTTVEYTPSSRWWSAGHNLPGVFPTVSKVTENDGRGTSFSTTYSHADGLWARQPDERRFLGFGSSREVLDADGTYRETLYRQTLAGAGQVDRVYLKNATGQVYDYEQHDYLENTAPPYQSHVSSTSRFECNLTATCRRARTDFSYDGYGNVTLEVDYGDAARGGDELTTATTYAQNTTAYIVDTPATVTGYAGTSTAATQVARSVHFYDEATSPTTAPTAGDQTRQDDWNSDTGGYVTVKAGYDAWGNVVSATDARGATTTTAFDPMYHLFATRSCNALDQCTETGWDFVLGQPTSVTDPNLAVTQTRYDALGRQTSEQDPGDNTTIWQYLDIGNPNGQRVREILPDGSADGLWSEAYFDGLGRNWQTVKEGAAPGSTYVQDRVFRSTTELVWKESQWRQSGQAARYTVFEYDGADRLRRTTHSDGAFTTATYGAGTDGLPFVNSVDELGHERATWSDVDDNVTAVREKNGVTYATTGYTYDVLGRLVRWIDAAGNSSTVKYNSLGWKTSMTDMDTGTWQYAYDDGGLLIRQTDAKNQVVTVAYDPLSRIKTRTEPGNQVATWFYDEAGFGASAGRLTRTTYPAGSDSHTWNTLGQETGTAQCVDTVCKSMSSAFDGVGRLKTLTYPDGEQVGYTYNPAGQLSAVGGYVTAMTWNANDQLASMTYANGTTTTYSYDANRDWLRAASVTTGSATLYQASYGYNTAGLLTSMTQGTPGPATTEYGYDDLNRLVSVSGAQNQSFNYDAIGNITFNSLVGTYTYGDPAHRHAVTAAGAVSYTHDANGNAIGGDGRTLTWDSGDRLASVTRGGVTTSFAYDAGDRRLKKVSGTSTTRYFGAKIEQVDGALVKYYYAGPVLVARSAGGVKTWYHADRLGSTRLMTNAAGVEVRDYDYQPFGEQSSTGSAANERTFTGHIRDDSTGLLYMSARYEDPKLGRFISPDSLIPDPEEPQDINRYSYVRNNPVNNVDPTGNAPAGCDAACIRSWSKKQNDAAKKRASAKPKPSHRPKRSFSQERWEKQTRTRLGKRTWHRTASRSTSRSTSRATPHKKRGCDEIWCFRTRDGRAKRKADMTAPDWRANNKNYVHTCSRGPANYGPEACGYRYVGPTWGYPTYCRGVCAAGAFWPWADPQSITVEGVASQLVRLRFRNTAWHSVHVAVHTATGTYSTEVGPGRQAEIRVHRMEFPVDRPGNTLAHHRFTIEVHNPTMPLAWQACSGDCGPRRFVTTNPSASTPAMPDVPF